MMRVFYGLHLKSGKLSAAFDVVRYLSEPDSIRFSHITLRGPYTRVLARSTLQELNESRDRDWCVRLDGAGGFIGQNQNTVLIKIDLMDLSDLFYKPDFVEGLPHLTLYDGADSNYARSLLGLLYRFDFHEVVPVSTLQKISPKAPMSGSSAVLYKGFYDTYKEFVGDQSSDTYIRSLTSLERLSIIERILVANFEQLIDKLRPAGDALNQLRLPFDGDD